MLFSPRARLFVASFLLAISLRLARTEEEAWNVGGAGWPLQARLSAVLEVVEIELENSPP